MEELGSGNRLGESQPLPIISPKVSGIRSSSGRFDSSITRKMSDLSLNVLRASRESGVVSPTESPRTPRAQKWRELSDEQGPACLELRSWWIANSDRVFMDIPKAAFKHLNLYSNIDPGPAFIGSNDQVDGKSRHYYNGNEVSWCGKKFIIAQGPTEPGVHQFWMLCCKEASVVVQCSPQTEAGKRKFTPYYEPEAGSCYKAGGFQVTTMASPLFEPRVHTLVVEGRNRSLELEYREESEERRHPFRHISLTEWPDHGAYPDLAELLQVIASLPEEGVLFHCSAGVGRSGVAAALHMLQLAEKYDRKFIFGRDPLDVATDLVRTLRTVRPACVQSHKQFYQILDAATIYVGRVTSL